jgi:hypothetical protein
MEMLRYSQMANISTLKKEYERIESNVRSDKAHINRIREWYESQGGKEHIFREHIISVRNEEIFSTVTKK